MLFYSASSRGFFDDSIAAELPQDAVEISQELHRQMLDGEQSGMVISPGEDGFPHLTEAPPPSNDDLARHVLLERDARLGIAAIRIAPLQDAVDLGKASDTEVASLKAWKGYRVDLNRVTDQDGFPGNVDWPSPPESN